MRTHGGALRPVDAGAAGGAAGAAAGAAIAAGLFAANPLFYDRFSPAVALFVLFPLLLGLLAGFAAGALRRGRRRSRRAALAFTAAVAAAVGLQAALHAASARREQHPPHLLKMLVIGVDGATWRVMDPLLAAGELPAWERLRAQGAWGTCRSMQPMFSNRLFTTIATGKVPEKHGIIGYEETATDLRVPRLWDILGARGWVTGIMEWYVTWPPEVRESGFTVPGIYSRSNATSPERLRFLRELRSGAKAGQRPGILRSAGYGWQLLRHGVRLSTLLEAASVYRRMAAGDMPDLERYRAQHFLWQRIQTDVFCRLVETYEIDFGAALMKLTDSVGHIYWKYFEPARFSGVSEEDRERYGRVIPDAYRMVDRALERLSRRVAPSGVLAVISDHGFEAGGGSETGIASLRTATLLRSVGLEAKGWQYINIGGAAYLMLPAAGDGPPDEAAHSAALREAAAIFEGARARGTVAAETGLKGGRPVFIVEVHDSLGVGDDFIGLGIQRDLIREQAGGDHGPEILFPGGERLALGDIVVTSELSGDHADDGVLLLRGPGVRAGAALPECSLPDLAPTLLALAGLPVGEDMDGRVLEEAFTPEFAAAHPVSRIPTHDSPEVMPRLTAQPEKELPPEEIEKLKSLGYIE